ncbi:class I SAM-dependent methyltransferase [Candidatus Scalindua japonica]|nr:class I SAM-dependent methyltransferase [Candidatus Scalindua japonica]
MNLGYAASSDIDLEDTESDERYSFQLYHHVASPAEFHDHEVLEVGCGRGGGAYFIKKYLNPKSMVGLDLAGRAVKLCKEKYGTDGLDFINGDAEALPFLDNSFDIVINVESAFHYPSRDDFFREVKRVLRKDGYFLYADVEIRNEVESLDNSILEAGFTLLKREVINDNVIKACDLDSIRRKRIIDSSCHPLFRFLAYNIPAVPDSRAYNKIKSGEIQYLCYALKKSENELLKNKNLIL